MTDKTTMGITAEPEEVEAVLNNLCGYHLAERDPVFRYTVLTREQVLYEALANAIKRERGRALAELTGLGTRQRVQRLMQLAKAAEAAAAELLAKDELVREIEERLDFDERLAAVHATLEGVVPAITDDTPAPVEVNQLAAVVNEPTAVMVVAEPTAVMVEASRDFAEVIAAEPVADSDVIHAAVLHSDALSRDTRLADALLSDALVREPFDRDVVINDAIDDDRAEADELDSDADVWLAEQDYVGLTEPTQVIPALAAPRHRRTADDPPWWRRSA